MLKIGVIVGREWSWPPAFIEEVNKRDEGVTAEYAQLGGTRMNEPSPYAVLVDRISHEVPYYRSYLKNAMLQGSYVINNPFMWTADDKFFGASLITKLGIASPKTVVLPNKEYVPGIVHNESLRNLVYPTPWEEHVEYLGGFPVVLKDAHGGGWKNVAVCGTLDELWWHYNQSGLLGVSGISSDMREILKAADEGHHRALLALKAYCYRVRKYLGAYAAAMGGLDAVIFTGGIGQGSAEVRALALQGLDCMGVRLDAKRNCDARGFDEVCRISPEDSKVAVLVVPTDEERMMAREALRTISR